MASLEDRIDALERQLAQERRFKSDLLEQNEQLNKELSRFRDKSNRVDASTQTSAADQPVDGEKEWISEAQSQGSSIADSLKAFLTAKSSDIARKDFIYNEALGMYYNPENGLMYDGKRYMCYDYEKNVYLYYDEATGEYKEEEKPKKPSRKASKKKAMENGTDKEEIEQIDVSSDSSEEGELDEKDSSLNASPKIIPCVRMVVFRSDCLSSGDLYIATCDRNFAIGRDKSRDMILMETLVSKFHAVISYSKEESTYCVEDFGSQNGTFLNGERLSEPKIKSGKAALSHEDLLVIGSTTLVVHIHENADTCDNCEPGIVREKWKKIDRENPPISNVSIKDLHKQQMLELKKKYGLQREKFMSTLPTDKGFYDRARTRRKTFGTDHEAIPRPTETASVDQPISEQNKGFKLLSKMGWNEGEGLNSKRKADSLVEPIGVTLRLNDTAGLGSEADQKVSVEDGGMRKSRNDKWAKAAKRYHGLPTTSAPNAPVGSKGNAEPAAQSGSTGIRWVKGGTVGPQQPQKQAP